MSLPPTVKNSSAVPGQLPPDDVLFGRSSAMAAVRARADKVCHTNIGILLCGDAGTGKETVARWIHTRSAYRAGQFVKVNCAAIPGSLLESELFGYERGAFTGAQGAKPGRVELANGGTLFLDEIADLDINLQSKLLQFLQDGRFSRIGGDEERRVDTRVICATNKEVQQEIDAGRFRADLFYRISVVQLRLPRLHQRREDIPALAEYFRTFYEEQFERESQSLSPETLEYLQNLEWQGNVRELSNGIARYVLIGPDAVIAVERPVKPTSIGINTIRHSTAGVPLKCIAKDAVRELERNMILETLRANQWNRRKAAQELKISYRALIYKIRNAGLAPRSRRGADSKQPSGGTD